MTVLTDLLLKRAGLHGDQPANGDGPNIPPFILNILEKYGITPDAIKNYAETFKTLIVGKLDSIDARLSDIQDRLSALEQAQNGVTPAAPLPLEMLRIHEAEPAAPHRGEMENELCLTNQPTMGTAHNG